MRASGPGLYHANPAVLLPRQIPSVGTTCTTRCDRVLAPFGVEHFDGEVGFDGVCGVEVVQVAVEQGVVLGVVFARKDEGAGSDAVAQSWFRRSVATISRSRTSRLESRAGGKNLCPARPKPTQTRMPGTWGIVIALPSGRGSVFFFQDFAGYLLQFGAEFG